MLSRLLIIIPVASSIIGLALFNMGIPADNTDTLLRDFIFFICTALVFTLILIKGKLKKDIVIFIVYLLTLVGLSILSFFQDIPVVSTVKAVRDSSTLVISIIIGYSFISKKELFQIGKLLVIISSIIIVIEYITVPSTFWQQLRYTDYFLEKQAADIEASGGELKGYYNEETIVNMYENYDSWNGEQQVNYRYGGIFGLPIEFGHVFAFLTIIILMQYKNKNKRSFYLLLLIVLSLGLFFVSTKGYIVTVALYLFSLLFLKYKFLRIPIIFFSSIGVSMFLYYSFRFETSAVGHVDNLILGLQEFSQSPIFGSGLGSSGGRFDDSYLAQLLVEGGLVLGLFYFVLFLVSFIKVYFRSKEFKYTGSALIVATFVPPILTGAAMHFLSIFLFGYFIGMIIRSSKDERYEETQNRINIGNIQT